MFSAFNKSYTYQELESFHTFFFFSWEQLKTVGITSFWKSERIPQSNCLDLELFLEITSWQTLFFFLFPLLLAPSMSWFCIFYLVTYVFPENYPFSKVFKCNKLHVLLFYFKNIVHIYRIYTFLFFIMGASVSFYPCVFFFFFFNEELGPKYIIWLFFYYLFH